MVAVTYALKRRQLIQVKNLILYIFFISIKIYGINFFFLEEFNNKTVKNFDSFESTVSFCNVITVDKKQTLGIIAVNNKKHGLCKNEELIEDFSQCYGTCNGKMQFDAGKYFFSF